MTTKEKRPAVMPGLFSGDGKDPETSLPRSIPEGTGRLAWPAFSWAVLTYDTGTKRLSVAVGACALVIAAAAAFMVQVSTAPLVFVLGGLLAYVLAFLLCKGQAIRVAQILRRDENGAVYLDSCDLWIHEESAFPDIWRWSFRGRRILVLDATDGERAWPFDPWLAELPAGKGSPSPIDLEQSVLESEAIAEILRVDTGIGETIKAALIIALAAGGLIAFYMAGDQGLKIMGFVE